MYRITLFFSMITAAVLFAGCGDETKVVSSDRSGSGNFDFSGKTLISQNDISSYTKTVSDSVNHTTTTTHPVSSISTVTLTFGAYDETAGQGTISATISSVFGPGADGNFTSPPSGTTYNGTIFNGSTSQDITGWNHTGYNGNEFWGQVYKGTYTKYLDPDFNDADGTQTLCFKITWESWDLTVTIPSLGVTAYSASTPWTQTDRPNPEEILMQYNWTGAESDKSVSLTDTGYPALDKTYIIQ